jgi:hypothetical protein
MSTILKAVDGDFRFIEGSLREKMYHTIRAARGHTKSQDAIREQFGEYLGFANALRVLRSRGQVVIAHRRRTKRA